MRTILALAAVTITSAAAPHAEACGVYMMSPRVFIIASSNDRNFALARADATDATFEMLDPRSYDPTAVAPAPALPQPFALELLGANGAHRSVTTARQVLVKNNFASHGTQLAALDLPVTGWRTFQIAVAGHHTDLGWTPLTLSSTPDGLVSQITDVISAASVYDDALHDYRTTLHDKTGAVIGDYVGLPRGVLAADGQQHLVVDDNGVAHAYLID